MFVVLSAFDYFGLPHPGLRYNRPDSLQKNQSPVKKRYRSSEEDPRPEVAKVVSPRSRPMQADASSRELAKAASCYVRGLG